LSSFCSIIKVKEITILTVSTLARIFVVFDASQGSDTVVHQLQGLVDILLFNLGSEVQLGHGLRDSDDTKESTGSDVHVRHFFIAFTLELSLLYVLCNNIVVELSWNGWFKSLCVSDEGTHGLGVNLVCIDFNWSVQSLMDLSDMPCKFLI